MGLRRLISRLDSGQSFGNDFPNHNTPDNVGGFNYGESISIFDVNQTNNDFFPFKQRSLGYGPQGAKDDTGVFGRIYGPAPYIKQRLPDLNPNKLGPGDSGPLAEDALGVIDSITDVGVRGGLITSLKRSGIDAARIGEYLLTANGLGFIAKNVGLQASNPRLQEGAGRLGRNRLYNLGVNTLAQTLTAATGLHVNRAGLLPIGKANYRVEQGYRVDSSNDTKYEYHVRGVDPGQKGGTGNVTGGQSVYNSNRLTALYNRLLNPFSEIGGNTGAFTAVTNPELYEFRGGPHSVYGIGKTRLKRYVFTARDVAKAETEIVQQNEGYKISRHLGSKTGPKQAVSTGHIIDFRKNRGLPYTMYDQKLGEGGDSIEKRFGYPRGVSRVGAGLGSIPTNDDGTINVRSAYGLKDRINSTDIWIHEGPWDTTKLGKEVRDYIKFRIEAVDTDSPSFSSTMVFRAFLDSMDDNYSSKWNEYNYNGRAEPFYTFGSFNRSISFSFKVAAFSRDDMRPMYRKLNYLVSQTAGEYKDTRLRGNFCRLTIGDYHSRLPGFFTSINLKWNKEYPWEIAMYQNGIGTQASEDTGAYSENPQNQQYSTATQQLAQAGRERAAKNNVDLGPGSNADYGGPESTGRKVDMDSDMLELPHILDVSCQFQPVHDFIPKKSIKESPFILPTKFSKPDIKDLQDWLKIDPISQTRIDIQNEIAEQEEKDIEADIAREEEEERLRQEEERKMEEERRKILEEEEERKFLEEMERMMELEEELEGDEE